MKKIIREILNCISKIKKEDYLLVENLIKKHKRIFIYGTGRSGLIGRCFCMRLFHLGFNSYFVGDITTPRFTKKDILILISSSGEKSTCLEYARICKKEKGKILLITSNKNSELAKMADFLIDIPIKNSIQFGSSLFEQVCFLFFDFFIQFYIEKNKVKKELMKKRHTNLE
ncbi:MAG: SIS domain-containing protein [bacterium]|nr:SIS domain-containing protein [bacterium]